MDSSANRLLYVCRRWSSLPFQRRWMIYWIIWTDGLGRSRLVRAVASGMLAAAVLFLALDGGWLGFFAGLLVGYYISSMRIYL